MLEMKKNSLKETIRHEIPNGLSQIENDGY
jgi:hypothetical protein